MIKELFSPLQRLGKAFMLPIAVLPAAGLLLGIGGALSNPNSLEAYPFLNVAFLQAVFTVMAAAGSIVFANLALLFAVGVAVGLAKGDKGTAALAAVVGFLVMNATMSAILSIRGQLALENLGAVGQGMVLGIQTLETGVFGGILMGAITSSLHGRYNKIVLPQVLGFFGGSRFVPIVCAFSAIIVGMVLYIIWPPLQRAIGHAGSIVTATGYVGTFFYGMFLRLLGPLGLHHIFYLPFWTTALGGSLEVNGVMVEGTQKIFFAQLADPSTVKYYEGVSRFMSGRFITMMFGLPGAALALYHCAKIENRAKVFGLLLSAALTSFLTGITEPLEFAFLFAAPVLYGVHAFFDGLAFMVANIFSITVGQTFSGGFIDFILFGVLQGNAKTNYLMIPLVGAGWFFLYYFSFKFLIMHYSFKTLGREDEAIVDEVEESANEQLALFIERLGGKDNIIDIDCCATRLRLTVVDPTKLHIEGLKALGSKGTLVSGQGVQIIYGPLVTVLKNQLEELLQLE